MANINITSWWRVVSNRNPFDRLYSAWRDITYFIHVNGIKVSSGESKSARWKANGNLARFLPGMRIFDALDGTESDPLYAASFRAFVEYIIANKDDHRLVYTLY